MENYIEIKNAQTNNLQGVNLKIQMNAITCFTGPSGSGKSSLAFRTLFSESKRRFMNSLPNSFKFFSEKPAKVEVDRIFPVLPAWSLPQNNPILSSRQNVADLLGITRTLLKAFAIAGVFRCPEHSEKLLLTGVSKKLENYIKKRVKGEIRSVHFFVQKDLYKKYFAGEIKPSRSIRLKKSVINEYIETDHFYEILRLRPNKISELEERLNQISPNWKQLKLVVRFDLSDSVLELEMDDHFSCSKCDFSTTRNKLSLEQLSVFNPIGACSNCKGHGTLNIYDRKKMIKDPSISIEDGGLSIVASAHFNYYYPSMQKELLKKGYDISLPFSKMPQKIWKDLNDGMGDFPGLQEFFKYLESNNYKKTVRIFKKRMQTEVICPECEGTRANPENHSLSLDIENEDFLGLKEVLNGYIFEINEKAQKLKLKELKTEKGQVVDALKIAIDLGLGYLPLNRKVKTLSASEYQRVLLIKYFLFKGSGSLFVFDEPSLGLRIEEQKMVFKYLEKLKKQNNTIVVVDHSVYFGQQSDFVVKVGPGAGPYGGKIVYHGKPISERSEIIQTKKIKRLSEYKESLKIKKIKFYGNELCNLEIPLGKFVCVKGAPGVGKTKVLMDGVVNTLNEKISQERNLSEVSIIGMTGSNLIDGFDSIDGNSLKSNSRSSMGTYLEVLPEFRKYYAGLPTSKAMGLEKGHFSSNSNKGKCLTCEGRGNLEADMKYFESVVYKCPDCNGLKLKPMFANISNGRYCFHEIISKPFIEIYTEIGINNKISRIKNILESFRLDYLSMNRSLSSLSGGERQRLKLAKFFLRPKTDHLLFIENLSFGLSELELEDVTNFLRQFVKSGNSLVVIDPNVSVEKKSDNILEFLRKDNQTITTLLS